jgi:hypothetical protein
VIYRVEGPGTAPHAFASVPQALVMTFGFDGDLFVGTAAGKVIRVLADGTTVSFSQVPTPIEGIAFDRSSEYSSRLYVSEWLDGSPGRVSAINADGSVSAFAPIGTGGGETAGLEFCGSPVRLYAADQSGTMYQLARDGSSSLLGGVNLDSQMQQGEALACGKGATKFGEYLYVAEQGYNPAGRILRVSLDGHVEVFASGFQGFDGWGVTGLAFSADGESLYVTDDVGRSIYAIRTAASTVQDRVSLFTGQGFDKCDIPALAQMQTWITRSPYRVVNLYIGGSRRACANEALSASYVRQLSRQGWKFIPTWVGPHCVYGDISGSAATASSQGFS